MQHQYAAESNAGVLGISTTPVDDVQRAKHALNTILELSPDVLQSCMPEAIRCASVKLSNIYAACQHHHENTIVPRDKERAVEVFCNIKMRDFSNEQHFKEYWPKVANIHKLGRKFHEWRASETSAPALEIIRSRKYLARFLSSCYPKLDPKKSKKISESVRAGLRLMELEKALGKSVAVIVCLCFNKFIRVGWNVNDFIEEVLRDSWLLKEARQRGEWARSDCPGVLGASHGGVVVEEDTHGSAPDVASSGGGMAEEVGGRDAHSNELNTTCSVLVEVAGVEKAAQGNASDAIGDGGVGVGDASFYQYCKSSQSVWHVDLRLTEHRPSELFLGYAFFLLTATRN